MGLGGSFGLGPGGLVAGGLIGEDLRGVQCSGCEGGPSRLGPRRQCNWGLRGPKARGTGRIHLRGMCAWG